MLLQMEGNRPKQNKPAKRSHNSVGRAPNRESKALTSLPGAFWKYLVSLLGQKFQKQTLILSASVLGVSSFRHLVSSFQKGEAPTISTKARSVGGQLCGV